MQDYKLTIDFSSGLPDDLNEDLRIQRLQDWLGFAQMNNRECDIETAHKATFKWALQPRKDPKTSTTPSPNLAKFLRDRDGRTLLDTRQTRLGQVYFDEVHVAKSAAR